MTQQESSTPVGVIHNGGILMEVNGASPALNKARDGIKQALQWLGRTFKNLGTAIVEGCKTAVAGIAKLATYVWDKAQPALTKVQEWMRSPTATFAAFTALGAVLVWKSNEQKDNATKLAMQGLGLGSALVAGMLLKGTGIV